MTRTTEEFVEDMVSDGRSWREIKYVAMCTRWSNVITDVKEIYRKLKRRIGKVENHGNKKE